MGNRQEELEAALAETLEIAERWKSSAEYLRRESAASKAMLRAAIDRLQKERSRADRAERKLRELLTWSSPKEAER